MYLGRVDRSSQSRELASRFSIARELERSIRAGDYAAGDKLPSVRKLSLHYEVAPNTAREALKVVAKFGLVRVSVGRGYFVSAAIGSRPIDGRTILDQTSELSDLERTQLTVPVGDAAYELIGRAQVELFREALLSSTAEFTRADRRKVVLEWRESVEPETVAQHLLFARTGLGEYVGIPGLRIRAMDDDSVEMDWLVEDGATLTLLRRSR